MTDFEPLGDTYPQNLHKSWVRILEVLLVSEDYKLN